MWRMLITRVWLTIILSLVAGAVLAGTRQALHNPFAAYEAIMPGQPSANLENYPCNTYGDDTSTVCTFSLKEGSFRSVAVGYDHTIKWISFTVRSGRLYLSDLILCWGRPTGVVPSNRLYEIGRTDLHWGMQRFANFIADQNDTRLSYLLPIYYVSIAGEWKSCHSE
jgi:hypothetical protein